MPPLPPPVLAALIGCLGGCCVGAVPLLLWWLNRPGARVAAHDDHTEVLIKLLDKYEAQLAAAEERGEKLTAQVAAASKQREKLLAQVSELRTAVDSTAQQQVRQAEQHRADMERMRSTYERQLGEKEMQIVGLRGRVEELEKRIGDAGSGLKGETPHGGAAA